MNIESIYNLFLRHPSVETDSRKLAKNDIFFALKGPSFNGNLFAKEAIEKGAAYAIVDEKEFADDDRIFFVDDVLKTLQDLAKHHRKQFSIPFIAITGSNGKTTTKELIHAVLSSTFRTYTTKGNLNNHIGIPITILQVKKDAEMAVIEMGANHQKEIEGYCEYTMPTHGLITNVGKAHLEGFGGEEGVRKGKGELFDYLRKSGGSAFIMADYDYLSDMSKGIREIIRYGSSNSDYTGKILESSPFLKIMVKKGADIPEQKTQLVGLYNFPNVLAAIAVGKHFGVADEKIKVAIADYAPSNSRSQLMEWMGNRVILDAYNANPSSMKLAIENFAALNGSEKILLLGGMAELGSESLSEHESIVKSIQQHKWKEVVLVGGDFMKIDHPFKKFKSSSEAAAWLRDQKLKDAYLLVKGSRSMQMEKVLE